MPSLSPLAKPCESLVLENGFPLFILPTGKVLAFLALVTGEATPRLLHRHHLPPLPSPLPPLHLNLGIPGVESPLHPIEENADSLALARHHQLPSLPVILSGDLHHPLLYLLVPGNTLFYLRNTIRDLALT